MSKLTSYYTTFYVRYVVENGFTLATCLLAFLLLLLLLLLL